MMGECASSFGPITSGDAVWRGPTLSDLLQEGCQPGLAITRAKNFGSLALRQQIKPPTVALVPTERYMHLRSSQN